MVLSGHTFDRRVATALVLIALVPLARAGDGPKPRAVATAAPVVIPHAENRALAEKASKAAARKSVVDENYDYLALRPPGLLPVNWPSNTDNLRANLLTPQLKSTPVVGWIAENLYRDKSANGWSVQLDGGEYVVLYRYHPKK